jgi:hypothetical protein
MAEKETVKSELAKILPEFVDESGKFVLPTSSSFTPENNRSDRSGNVEVRWYEDPAAQAAIIGGGATAGYLGSKLMPPVTNDVRAERKLANLIGQQQAIAPQIETARAPVTAAQTAADAARAEVARNRMLMEAVTKRAMDLGIDPRDFVRSPELFEKAMAPEAGYGSKNWFKSEYGNVNPIVENRLTGKGGAKEAVGQYMATEPKAQRVVGPTVQQESGVLRPRGTGPEATRAGMMVGNVDKTLQEAILAAESAKAEHAVAQAAMNPRLENEASKLERQIAGQRADIQAAAQKGPGTLDRMAKMLSGPKTSAGLGALSAYKLPQAYKELTEGDYRNALLHGLEGVSGGLMLAPHPLVKALGLAAAAPAYAFEYGPQAYDAFRQLFNSSDQKKK